MSDPAPSSLGTFGLALILGGIVTHFLWYVVLLSFLASLNDCLSKVDRENRAMRPGRMWLALIPAFGAVWLVCCLFWVSRSVRNEYEARDEDTQSDYGRGLAFGVMACALSLLVPPLGVLGAPVGAVLLGVYWLKVARWTRELAARPDGVFWDRYNSRLELPSSLAASLLMAAAAFGLIVLLMNVALGTDKSSVPIRLVQGGFDDDGEGSPGSGGTNDPAAIGQQAAPQKQDFEALPLQQDLPKVKEEMQRIAIDDPNAATPISDEKAAAYASLDQAVRDKLLGTPRGAGPGQGSGDTGQAGRGPGGNGADATRARSLRWVLRFSTRSGRDYLDQLQSLGATVLVPTKESNKQMYIFRDLTNPRPGTLATDAEMAQLGQQIQFCDFKKDSVVQVGEALGLNYVPPMFWAFFPKDLEAELARLEIAYRNRRPEDVEETTFVVTVRNGKYQLVVTDQKAKR